jgi:hypothetical protein
VTLASSHEEAGERIRLPGLDPTAPDELVDSVDRSPLVAHDLGCDFHKRCELASNEEPSDVKVEGR